MGSRMLKVKARRLLLAPLMVVLLGLSPKPPAGQPTLPPDGPSQQNLRAYGVPGLAMEPTLRKGEVALLDISAYRSRPPERGDIVVYARPSGSRTWFAFRVIGIGGDVVQMRRGKLSLNGEALPQTAGQRKVGNQ